MKIPLKLVTIAFCFLFCFETKSEENDVCTTSVINNIINTQYASDSKLIDIWRELEAKTTVKIKDSDVNIRPAMVKIQAAIESSLVSLLKDGTIKYSKAAIYTPLIATPLRTNEFNLDTVVRKDFHQDPNRVQTITARKASIEKYLINGGMLYSIYNASKPGQENNISGLSVYKDNLNKYKTGLIDKPTENINTRYTGASYIAECKDGTKLFFAIKGRQANDTRKKQWVLYYGKLDRDSNKLNRYFKKVQELYKNAGVSFDFEQ